MDQFLNRLAAPTATPGGGAAACYAAAMASSLGQMVVGIQIGKGKGDPVLVARMKDQMEALLRTADEDGESFERVIEALRLPKDDPARGERVAQALHDAARVPLRAMALMQDLGASLVEARAHCPKSAFSDWEAAILLLRTAREVARKNVVVNLGGAKGRDGLRTDLAASDRAFEAVLAGAF